MQGPRERLQCVLRRSLGVGFHLRERGLELLPQRCLRRFLAFAATGRAARGQGKFSFHTAQKVVEHGVELPTALPEHQVLAHDDKLDGRRIRLHPVGDTSAPLLARHEQ